MIEHFRRTLLVFQISIWVGVFLYFLPFSSWSQVADTVQPTPEDEATVQSDKPESDTPSETTTPVAQSETIVKSPESADPKEPADSTPSAAPPVSSPEPEEAAKTATTPKQENQAGIPAVTPVQEKNVASSGTSAQKTPANQPAVSVSQQEKQKPVDWVVTLRKSALYEKPSYSASKVPLAKDLPLILHEKDRFGWYRVETAEKRQGWLPGFHSRLGEGPPPAVLVPPPEPPPQPPAPPPEPPPEIQPLSPEQIAARLKTVQLETSALRDFVRLQPSGTFKVSALFSIDLQDLEAISHRIMELSTRIAEKKRVVRFLTEQAKVAQSEEKSRQEEVLPAGDTTPAKDAPSAEPSAPPTPPVPSRLDLEKAELALLDLRQAFLSHKPEEIKILLEAEQEAERLARLKAKEEADRKRAEEEARLAEEARRLALERAEAATSAAERTLALERAKLEGTKGELAEFRKRLAIARQEMIALDEKRSQSLTETTALVGAARLYSSESDSLYDSIVGRLTLARVRIADELDAPGQLPKAPRFQGNPSELQVFTPEQVQEKADLIAGALKLESEADDSDQEMREIAWERVRSTVDFELALNQQRLILLERISPAKRGELLGFGPEGVAQFGRELVHFSLVLRWMEYAGERLAYEKLQQLKDPYQFLSIALPIFGLMLFILIYFTLRKVLKRYFERDRSRSIGIRYLGLADGIKRTLSGIARALYRELLFLGFVFSLPLFANVSAEQSAITLIYRLMLIYGFYRLIQAATFNLLLDLIRSNTGPLDTPRREKLMRTVIIATRFIFWMMALLMIAAYVLGKGYLYHLAVRVTIIGVFVITAGMIFWWRKKISADVIALRPNSGIARELERSSGRWYSLLLVYVGFFYLIGVGFIGSLRRLMQGFDLSQKVLAYIFRKKLEQQKEKIREFVAVQLPPEIEDYFGEHAEIPESLLLNHFPKMEAFLTQFEKWKKGGCTGSFLVLGKAGHGKTTWLREGVKRAGDFPSLFITLKERLVTPEKVLEGFSHVLLPGEQIPENIEELARRICAGERRLIVLDNMQYLFMRGVDTIRGWWAFNRLMEATSGHVFWLGAFAQNAYQFLAWVRNDNDAFRDSVILRGWDEKLVSELLAKRMEAAGWRARYDNLIPGRHMVYTESQVAEISADFNRLVWDFTLGAPEAVIHYWKKSLVPATNNTMDIQLFSQPDMSVLEGRDETDKFVLACVFWHQHIGVEEAAESLRFPLYACRDSLEKLRESGVLEFRDHDYGVTVEWSPLVYRYLRRKNLIRS